MRIFTFLTIALTFSLLTACSTIPVEDRAGLREEINQGADEALVAFVSKDPELQESIDTSVGYFIGHVTGAKVIVVGEGQWSWLAI